jgi:hypothetical protein
MGLARGRAKTWWRGDADPLSEPLASPAPAPDTLNQLLSGVQAATEDADPERFMSIHQEAMPAKMAWPELVSEVHEQGKAAPGLPPPGGEPAAAAGRWRSWLAELTLHQHLQQQLTSVTRRFLAIRLQILESQQEQARPAVRSRPGLDQT